MSDTTKQTFVPADNVHEHSQFSLKEAVKEQVAKEHDEYEMAEVTESSEIDQDKFDEMLDQDFTNACENIRQIAKQGETTLREMIELARFSDHPRAYEVVGQLMTKLTEINKDLIGMYGQHTDVKQKRRESKTGGSKPESGQGNTTNNTLVFNGSTADLLKHLEQRGGGNGSD